MFQYINCVAAWLNVGLVVCSSALMASVGSSS